MITARPALGHGRSPVGRLHRTLTGQWGLLGSAVGYDPAQEQAVDPVTNQRCAATATNSRAERLPVLPRHGRDALRAERRSRVPGRTQCDAAEPSIRLQMPVLFARPDAERSRDRRPTMNNLMSLTQSLLASGVPIADIPPTLVRMGWTKADAHAAVAIYTAAPPPTDPRVEVQAHWERLMRTNRAVLRSMQRRKGGIPWESWPCWSSQPCAGGWEWLLGD